MKPHDRKNGISTIVQKDNHEKHSFKINDNCDCRGGDVEWQCLRESGSQRH
jgi:hypothetical protein